MEFCASLVTQAEAQRLLELYVDTVRAAVAGELSTVDSFITLCQEGDAASVLCAGKEPAK